jgi:hypothetical protein
MTKPWLLDRVELNCVSCYSPACAFYVGVPISGARKEVTIEPLLDYDYDVIVTTSDVPGTGTVCVGGVRLHLVQAAADRERCSIS